MKTILLVALLVASCLATARFTPNTSESSKRINVVSDEITCESTTTSCAAIGASCSAGCPSCTAALEQCQYTAMDDAAICACAVAFVNCNAAAKDATCDSSSYHDQCLAQLTNCSCGTPYTGALTEYACDSNAYCSDSGKCMAVKAVGQPCNYSSECGDVNANPLWSYDYRCVNQQCELAYKQLPGDSCSSNSDCEFYSGYSLGCVSGVCASQAVGQVCPSSAADLGSECGPNLYCDDENTCRATLAIGASCNGNDTNVSGQMCGLTGACDAVSNVCTKYLSKTQGQSCSFEGECGSGLYCSMNTSTCKTTLQEISCTSDADCFSANPDYEGCSCDASGKAVCVPPTNYGACTDTINNLMQCAEDHSCLINATPSSCLEANCKMEYDCYVNCFTDLAVAANFAGTACNANYVNTCPNTNFGTRTSVAWALVATASAAAVLL